MTATCLHIRLNVGHPLDAPQPIVCADCPTRFEIATALDHVKQHNATADPVRKAAIVQTYARAAYVDGDTGEYWYVMPDLNVDAGGAEKGYALEVFSDMVYLNLLERAEKGLMPPKPSTLEQLQEAHPSLSDWEWTKIAVHVTEYLTPERVA